MSLIRNSNMFLNLFIGCYIIEGKATFKIFRRVDDKVYLEPANSGYKRIELKEGMDVKLIKVTGVWTRKR